MIKATTRRLGRSLFESKPPTAITTASHSVARCYFRLRCCSDSRRPECYLEIGRAVGGEHPCPSEAAFGVHLLFRCTLINYRTNPSLTFSDVRNGLHESSGWVQFLVPSEARCKSSNLSIICAYIDVPLGNQKRLVHLWPSWPCEVRFSQAICASHESFTRLWSGIGDLPL